MLHFAEKNHPFNLRRTFALGPDAPDAHDELNNVIEHIVGRIVSSRWYHKDTELQAMDWLEDQFTGHAADQWHLVAREASRTATTSGICPNRVLYSALRDIIAAYPAHEVKAAILRCRTVVYNRAVEQSRNLDATLVLSAQDWSSILTEMQVIFQPWVLAFITNFPARFTNMADCWEAIITEATRQSACSNLGFGGRVNQIAAANTTVVGRLDGA